jgi:Uma2 family endonuclease
MTAAERFRLHDDTPHEDHFVYLRGLSWEDFEHLLELRGDQSAPRFTYLEGTLEIMSPSKDHEGIKSLIGRLVEAWCIDRGIELMPYGSWTLKKEKKKSGAEPDECYVFGGEPRDRSQLAIEVEWTSRGLDKMEVYRRLGVDEVWWWRKGEITIFVLDSGAYKEAERSAALPDLDVDLLASFLDRPTLTQAVREFRVAAAASKG